jgi:hypothetical protein
MKSFSIFSTSSSAINKTQKNIIEATFNVWFDEIFKLNREHAIRALNIILQQAVSAGDIQFLNSVKIWPIIKDIRKIIDHPAPQNRSEDNPYLGRHSNPNMVVFKNSQGNYAFEERGLLGLSARNDDTALAITKYATIEYIYSLTNKAIHEVTNHIYLGTDEKVASALQSAKKISDRNWVVCIRKNIADDCVSIYLEGIKSNGFHFIYKYQMHCNLIGITYLENKLVKHSECGIDKDSLQSFSIKNSAGERLIQLVGKKPMSVLNASPYRLSGSSIGQEAAHSLEWASNKLKGINIDIDKRHFISSNRTFSCSLM